MRFILPIPFPSPSCARLTRHGRTLAAATFVCVLTACGSLPPNTGRTPTAALPLSTAASTTIGRQVAALAPAAAPSDARSGFRMLGDVESAYGARLALIDAAEKTLDLQYYSIHYDSSTEALLNHLKAAASRSVRVRVLIDDFNTGGKNAEVLRLDETPGIEVRLFNPVAGPRASQAGRIVGSLFDFQRIQQRMHNKALIADNALAIAGGRNLGNEYFGQDTKSNFLDLDLLVAGPLVREFSRSFDRYWNDTLAYPAESLWPQAQRGVRDPAPAPDPEPAEAATPAVPPPTPTATTVPGADTVEQQIQGGQLRLAWAPAILLADKPSKISAETPDDPAGAEETVVEGLVRLIDRTQQDLLIISPYFVPGEDMMQTFAALRTRGVRVRVMTNSLASNDAPLAHVGYARYRPALLALGVELYELQARGSTHRRLLGSTPQSRSSLHSKALVMDGRMLVVGSMNLDLRSSLQNTETGMVIRSRALSQELQTQIEKSLADCYRVEMAPDGSLRWDAPANDAEHAGAVYDSEPEAGAGLRLLLKIIGPLAPDTML